MRIVEALLDTERKLFILITIETEDMRLLRLCCLPPPGESNVSVAEGPIREETKVLRESPKLRRGTASVFLRPRVDDMALESPLMEARTWLINNRVRDRGTIRWMFY